MKAIIEKTSDWDFEETIEVPKEVYDFLKALADKYDNNLIVGGFRNDTMRIEVYDDYRE